MPQFGRPEADVVNEGYTTQLGGGANLFQAIDEAVADDGDYIQSPSAPTSDVYVTSLSALEDPVSSTGHTVRYRYAKSAAGGAQINLVVELREGYVSEASQGTLLVQWTHNDISESPTTATQNLAGAVADAITDYADLALRFVFTQV